MKSNINSNQTFSGAYLINYKNCSPAIRQGFEKSVERCNKQVFNDFRGQKDTVLYILKNSGDYGAAQYVKTNNLKFKYIPELDTRLQFDSYYPDQVINYIKEHRPFAINSVKELMNFILQNRLKNMAKVDSHLSLARKILKNLVMDFKGKQTKNNKGVTYLKDELSNGYVCLSPKNKNGISYAIVKPNNSYEDEIRCAVDGDGKILARFQSPDGLLKFRENFNKAIKYHLNIER